LGETQQVTVVFTDLVGSTELSSRLDPEAADQLRAKHFALLRGAIESNGGTEVKNLGDGLMVVFTITSGALNGAEAMQQAIGNYNKRAAEPLSVRIGLSLGEVTEDDGDYFGDAVVEAARLCALANGDQILATQLVQLAAGRRAKQGFVSLGDVELRGLPEPVAAVEVRWRPVDPIRSNDVIPLPSRCAPTTAAGFVGRTSERALLDDALKQVESEGRHELVLIGGEPGMGKTTLATECARAAHEDGAIVLFGRSDEDLAVPYGPWAEALAHLIANAPQGLLETLSLNASSLVCLAPALATQLSTSDRPTPSDPEAARYMLFGAVAAALRAAGDVAPVVLVLDDLQWADAPSLQLLRHIATSDPMRVLVIGTFRESDVATGEPLADLLGALHREQGTERITLRGLTDLELLAMMEGAAGQKLDEDGLLLRDALLAETDGNPFFVGELLRHLVESGGITQVEGRWVGSAELRSQGLPVSVREVIGRRAARLGDLGTKVLSVAAVIGRDFELSLLAAASELDQDTLLDVLDKASEATLIENVEGNRYSFVHALIEHTLYDSLSPARRARLHRAVAEAIEAQIRGRAEGRASELAYHWAQAAVPEDLSKAVGYAKIAADEALARLAPAEALRWYIEALALLEQRAPGTDLLRCQLLVGLGDSQRQCGDPAHRETLLDAAHLAQDLGATHLLVAAALANSRGLASSFGRVDAERVRVLEAACKALKDIRSAEHAKLLALLSVELLSGSDLAYRKGLADQALAIARSLDDPRTLAWVMSRVIYAIDAPETLTERLALSAEGLDAARHSGDPALHGLCLGGRMIALYQSGDVVGGDEVLSEGKSLRWRLNQPTFDWYLAVDDSGRALLTDDLEESERFAFEGLELGTSTGQPDAATFFGATIATIRTKQGRSGELLELVRPIVDENPGLPGFAFTLAQIYCDIDQPDDARLVLEPFVAEGFTSVPHDSVELIALCCAADPVADLAWVDAAGILFERLRPFADQILCVGPVAGSEVSRYLGRLAAVLGLDEDVESYFSQSVKTHERIGAPWSLAMTRLSWGRYLATRGRPADLSRALSLLELALGSAQQRGYGLVERRARQALEALRDS
jgi:class 3 adenylate cyclase